MSTKSACLSAISNFDTPTVMVLLDNIATNILDIVAMFQKRVAKGKQTQIPLHVIIIMISGIHHITFATN